MKSALPFGKREKTYNTRLAQELGKWAGQKGKGTLFHDAMFRAFFVEGMNIGKKISPDGLVKDTGTS